MKMFYMNYNQVQRSVSQSDMHAPNARCIPASNKNSTLASNNNGTKLKRCASLPAQRRSVPYINSKDIKNLKTQLESSAESFGKFIIAFTMSNKYNVEI